MFMPLQVNLMRELLLLPVGISGRGNLLGRSGGGVGQGVGEAIDSALNAEPNNPLCPSRASPPAANLHTLPQVFSRTWFVS